MNINFKTDRATDGSIKYRFETSDGYHIEALYFIYNGGLNVLCLSTQIGCNMGCKFCGTGKQKRIRDLTQDEIVKQADLIVKDLPLKGPDTITLAGMGEPLSNYEASLGALENFRSAYGNIRLSLSTVGIKQGIRRMIDEKRSFGLYLSLHAADDNVRAQIMPTANTNSIAELVELLDCYESMNKPGTVRISYLMLPGISNTEEQFKKLVKWFKGKTMIVQLRLWNPVEDIDLSRVTLDEAEQWSERLNQAGVQACVRPSAGQELKGGCGQMLPQK